MSYEGYFQVLCENGHYHTYDAYDFCFDESSWKCPDCKTGIAWRKGVDQTNNCVGAENCLAAISEEEKKICEGHGCGYVELEVDKEEVTEKCPTCDHVKIVEPTRYKLPKK